MKRFLIGLFLVTLSTLFFCSCSTVPNNESTQTVIRILAQRIGANIATKDPALAQTALQFSKTFFDSDDPGKINLVNIGLTYFADHYNGADPLLESDLRDLVSLVGISTEPANMPINMDMLNMAMTAFQKGVTSVVTPSETKPWYKF